MINKYQNLYELKPAEIKILPQNQNLQKLKVHINEKFEKKIIIHKIPYCSIQVITPYSNFLQFRQ